MRVSKPVSGWLFRLNFDYFLSNLILVEHIKCAANPVTVWFGVDRFLTKLTIVSLVREIQAAGKNSIVSLRSLTRLRRLPLLRQVSFSPKMFLFSLKFVSIVLERRGRLLVDLMRDVE